MDTVVANRAELDFLVGLLAPRPVRLVTLAPGVEVCQQRNATRDPGERFEFDGYHRLEAEMRRDLGDIGWWFDTSSLTPAETAEQLVREAAELAEIARRHHLASGAVVKANVQGVANQVYFLGKHLVLRVASRQPDFVADLLKEAVVIPIAPPVPQNPVTDPWARAYRELGVELALLHGGGMAPESLPGIPADAGVDPRPGIADLACAGYLNREVADWLTAWFDRLTQYVPAEQQPCLIHGDACPTNLLADPVTARLNALLDWGDAAWADPSTDFAKLPLRAVPFALQGYLQDTDHAHRTLAQLLGVGGFCHGFDFPSWTSLQGTQ